MLKRSPPVQLDSSNGIFPRHRVWRNLVVGGRNCDTWNEFFEPGPSRWYNRCERDSFCCIRCNKPNNGWVDFSGNARLMVLVRSWQLDQFVPLEIGCLRQIWNLRTEHKATGIFFPDDCARWFTSLWQFGIPQCLLSRPATQLRRNEQSEVSFFSADTHSLEHCEIAERQKIQNFRNYVFSFFSMKSWTFKFIIWSNQNMRVYFMGKKWMLKERFSFYIEKKNRLQIYGQGRAF